MYSTGRELEFFQDLFFSDALGRENARKLTIVSPPPMRTYLLNYQKFFDLTIFFIIMNSFPKSISITVLTGFLGSGKTTLLSEFVKNENVNDVAFIINEFGEVGLDHNLIESSDET